MLEVSGALLRTSHRPAHRRCIHLPGLDTVHGQRGTDACISLLEEVHCCRPDLQKWFARPCPLSGEPSGDHAIFYRRMFSAHPELERNLFNRGNQAQGDQQRALAGSIAAYATLLLSETAPDSSDLLARVANKHASSASPPTSTPSCTSTSSGRSSKFSVTRSPRRLLRRGTRSTGTCEHVDLDGEELYADAGLRRARCGGSSSYVAGRRSPRHGVVRARIAGRRELPLARPDSTSPRRHTAGRCPPDPAVQPHPRPRAEGVGHHREGHRRGDERGRFSVPARRGVHLLAPNVFEGEQLTVSPPFGDLVLEDGQSRCC